MSKDNKLNILREWGKALWLFLLLYIVLSFADFGTGFQYVGF